MNRIRLLNILAGVSAIARWPSLAVFCLLINYRLWKHKTPTSWKMMHQESCRRNVRLSLSDKNANHVIHVVKNRFHDVVSIDRATLHTTSERAVSYMASRSKSLEDDFINPEHYLTSANKKCDILQE